MCVLGRVSLRVKSMGRINSVSEELLWALYMYDHILDKAAWGRHQRHVPCHKPTEVKLLAQDSDR